MCWRRVGIWRLLLTDPSLCEADALSEDERCRAGRFSSFELARRYIAAHVGLRRLLADHLGMSPAEVPVAVGSHGKPRIDPARMPLARVGFSLAHSQDIALVAIAEDVDVGVDVEWLGTPMNTDALVLEALTIRERAALPAHSSPGRSIALHRHWVRKEAVLKAVGLGLSVPPSLIETGPISASEGTSEIPFTFGSGRLSHWTDIPLPGQDAVAALATFPLQR